MKSLLKYLLIALIATTLVPVSSCKKGPNDPFLPFSSRKARAEGKWTYSKAEYTVTEIEGNKTKTTVFSFDGTFMNTSQTTKIGNGTPITNNGKYTYSETWTMNKDNTYSKSKVENGFPKTESGSWAFLNKNKNAELKNKEALILFSDKNVDGTSVTSNGKTNYPETILIDRLTKKELVITIDLLEVDGQDNTTVKGTYTYIQ